MAVDVALLLAFVVNASAQRRDVVGGHPQPINPPLGRNPISLRGSSGLIFRHARGGRELEESTPYVVPYPVYMGYGSADAAPGDPGGNYGTVMAPNVSGRAPYVDTRGPYVDDAGPNVDSAATSTPEPAGFGNTQRSLMESPISPEAQGDFPENLAHESGREASRNPTDSERSDASDGQALFLIALNDHRVYTAVAYWVEGQTLHYITPERSHNQVSLPLVDRQMSSRLNADSLVPFVLPP